MLYHSIMVKKGTKYKILKYLIENKKDEFSINNISKILKKDYKNTYKAVEKIKNSIQITKKANSCFLKYKPIFTDETYETEQIRLNEILNNKNLQLIYHDLKRISDPLFIAILVGSFAKKTNTKNSDIDICIISNSESINKEIQTKLSLLPLKIELSIFTPKEFVSMLNTKKFNVGYEIFQDGIIFKNIESYYQLIKNE